AGRLGIPKQRLELMGIQPEGRWFRLGWPPGKAPGGKAFLAQPKTLAIENEALQRLAPDSKKPPKHPPSGRLGDVAGTLAPSRLSPCGNPPARPPTKSASAG